MRVGADPRSNQILYDLILLHQLLLYMIRLDLLQILVFNQLIQNVLLRHCFFSLFFVVLDNQHQSILKFVSVFGFLIELPGAKQLFILNSEELLTDVEKDSCHYGRHHIVEFVEDERTLLILFSGLCCLRSRWRTFLPWLRDVLNCLTWLFCWNLMRLFLLLKLRGAGLHLLHIKRKSCVGLLVLRLLKGLRRSDLVLLTLRKLLRFGLRWRRMLWRSQLWVCNRRSLWLWWLSKLLVDYKF